MHPLRALPLLVVLAVILFVGLRSEPLPQAFEWQDKAHHALGFAALVVTLRIALPRRHLIYPIAISFTAALLIELAQALQPHRSPGIADLIAGAFGTFVGATRSLFTHDWSRVKAIFARRS